MPPRSRRLPVSHRRTSRRRSIASSRFWSGGFTKADAMTSEPEANIHRLWHEQPREEHPMSLSEIRAKAQRFERKTRRWNTVGAASIALLVTANTLEVFWPGQAFI